MKRTYFSLNYATLYKVFTNCAVLTKSVFHAQKISDKNLLIQMHCTATETTNRFWLIIIIFCLSHWAVSFFAWFSHRITHNHLLHFAIIHIVKSSDGLLCSLNQLQNDPFLSWLRYKWMLMIKQQHKQVRWLVLEKAPSIKMCYKKKQILPTSTIKNPLD